MSSFWLVRTPAMSYFLYHTDATCHPVSGAMSSCLYSTDATCHLVSGAMSSCLYSMDSTCHPVSGATWHLHFAKFAYFINTTERDKFLIRSPFEVKQMSLELDRRGLQSSVGFSEIGALQKNFLLGSSWIIPPH